MQQYVLTNQYVKNNISFKTYSPKLSETEKKEKQSYIVNNLDYILKTFDKYE